MNRQFTKEVQIHNKHMKRCWASSAKTDKLNNFFLLKLEKCKRLISATARQVWGVEKWALFYIVGGSINLYKLLEDNVVFLLKSENYISYYLVIPLPGIHPIDNGYMIM